MQYTFLTLIDKMSLKKPQLYTVIYNLNRRQELNLFSCSFFFKKKQQQFPYPVQIGE